MLSPVPDATVVLDATYFASVKHRDQRRQDLCASPFVNHPIETASILASVGRIRDTTILVSAILHDILEDTRTTLREFEDRFGTAVKCLVEELTDEPGLPPVVRRHRQLARIAHASSAAKQIRLADKIANLRSLPVQWSRTDCEKYIAFSEQVAVAVRGINAPLDALFLETARRARTTLREARGPLHGSLAPRIPAPPAVAADATAKIIPKTKLRRLQWLYSEAEELMDDIVNEDDDEPERSSEPLKVANPSGEKRLRPRPKRLDPALKKYAEPGIGSVEFRKIDARYVAVSIDGAREFRLPAGLACLLEVIASAEGDGPDGFMPFQSRREVAARLAKLVERPQADHTIVVAIGRLRWLLQELGKVNAYFVETDRQHVRLRLRRGKP